jgi:hypothetical protein
MPTFEWLRKEFSYGYDSGNILSFFPNKTRRMEERSVGGSYRKIFMKAVLPYLRSDAKVMELGPGKGAWSRAILSKILHGELHVLDFQDVVEWLKPELYDGRLYCHKVNDNSFSCVRDDYFDLFWSFGVLCHNNAGHIDEILKNALSKMKQGGIAVHQYADWEKLDSYGWERGKVPVAFRTKPDDEIWWPRNDKHTMTSIAERCGWTVLSPDLDLMRRDSIIVLQRNG